MNKTALITGASAGIGKDHAVIHASKGGNLVLVARREEALENLKNELTQEYGVEVKIIVKDLSEVNSAEEIYQEIKSEGIVVDYLINNAGFGGRGYFHEMDLKKQKEMINLNIIALVELTYKFLPEMIERNSGKILNVASSAGMVPGGPLQSVYFATKAFVLSFSQGLAGELFGTNVSVTALCPGATKTEFGIAADLENTKLFANVKYTAGEVARDGYSAMLKGEIVKVSALNLVDRLSLKLIPFVPVKIVLNQIKAMQEIEK